LIANGDQAGTWGNTTNTNLGTLLEQSITGVQTIVMADPYDYTLTSLSGVSDEARNNVLVVTGTLTAVRSVIAPLVKKTYLIKNNTSGGFAILIKAASGASVSIPNGVTSIVYCDGTNFNLGIAQTAVAAGTGISISVAGATTTINNTGVRSFNTRTGVVTQTSADITGALGYTPISPATAAASTGSSLVGTITSGTGAITRTVASKINEVISVLDFGADPTGVVDSLAAFNNAVTYAGSNGQINIPAGTYILSAGTSLAYWIVDSNASFTGVGASGFRGQEALKGQICGARLTQYAKGWKFGSSSDWVDAQRGNAENIATLMGNSPSGNYGVLGASRTSDTNISGNQATIGIGGFARNDNTTTTPLHPSAWAGYFEVYRVSGAGTTIGTEINIYNGGTLSPVHPYNFDYQGVTYGMTIDTGAGYTGSNGVSAGIIIGQNLSGSFNKGIVFKNTALDSDNTAIAFATAHALKWYNTSGNVIASLDQGAATKNLNINTTTNAILDNYYRIYTGAATPINTNIYLASFYASSDGSTFGASIASNSVSQSTTWSGGSARFQQQWSALNSGGGFTGIGINLSANAQFTPTVDNAISCGSSSLRWNNIYAGSGTIITTSDAREKQQIADLTVAEKAVATAIKGMFKTFKFNDAVNKKGSSARIHVGVIAQDIQAVFIANGLNPDNYSLFCYDEWEDISAVVDENGNISVPAIPAGSRYGIRYEELLAFVISAL